tara:strand:- start:284 stop:691 length:408 start_codon:yes stop_codon:yes gene_type:complete
MAWDITKISDSSERIIYSCVSDATGATATLVDPANTTTTDTDFVKGGSSGDSLFIEELAWSCDATGRLTIQYNASADQIAMVLSRTGSMGANNAHIIAKPNNPDAGGFTGAVEITNTAHRCTLFIVFRKSSEFEA